MTTITLTKAEHRHLLQLMWADFRKISQGVIVKLKLAQRLEDERKAARNPHRGSTLKSLLQEDGTYKEVKSKATKRSKALNKNRL